MKLILGIIEEIVNKNYLVGFVYYKLSTFLFILFSDVSISFLFLLGLLYK